MTCAELEAKILSTRRTKETSQQSAEYSGNMLASLCVADGRFQWSVEGNQKITLDVGFTTV